jgi:hypothetical protein
LKRFARNTQVCSMDRPAKPSESSARFVHAADEGEYFRAFVEKYCKKRSLVRFT